MSVWSLGVSSAGTESCLLDMDSLLKSGYWLVEVHSHLSINLNIKDCRIAMTVANMAWTEIASHIYTAILQVSCENYSSIQCKATIQSQSVTPYSKCENTSKRWERVQWKRCECDTRDTNTPFRAVKSSKACLRMGENNDNEILTLLKCEKKFQRVNCNNVCTWLLHLCDVGNLQRVNDNKVAHSLHILKVFLNLQTIKLQSTLVWSSQMNSCLIPSKGILCKSSNYRLKCNGHIKLHDWFFKFNLYRCKFGLGCCVPPWLCPCHRLMFLLITTVHRGPPQSTGVN